MNKKLVNAICACLFVISAGICSIGYAIGSSDAPWWLAVFAAGLLCAIISMIGDITREEDSEKKHSRIIGCICASISMISVFIFLTVLMFTNFPSSWIIVCVGGIISFVIYTFDKAMKK